MKSRPSSQPSKCQVKSLMMGHSFKYTSYSGKNFLERGEWHFWHFGKMSKNISDKSVLLPAMAEHPSHPESRIRNNQSERLFNCTIWEKRRRTAISAKDGSIAYAKYDGQKLPPILGYISPYHRPLKRISLRSVYRKSLKIAQLICHKSVNVYQKV